MSGHDVLGIDEFLSWLHCMLLFLFYITLATFFVMLSNVDLLNVVVPFFIHSYVGTSCPEHVLMANSFYVVDAFYETILST